MTDLPDQAHANCPIGDLLARLGDKWSMLVLVTLARSDRHCLRFSELMRQVGGISQRMLTTTLRHLERDGILTRQIYPEVPPRVEYTVAERGREMLIPVQQLVHWIVQEWPEIEKSRADYDVKNKKTGSALSHEFGGQ
jgi:DNA-binding HxlR family transcriptional regulator